MQKSPGAYFNDVVLFVEGMAYAPTRNTSDNRTETCFNAFAPPI
jgi:hypothetical protein